MRPVIYKCLNSECAYEFKGANKDGARCPKCSNPIVPLNLNPMQEELLKVPEYNDLKKTSMLYRLGIIKVSGDLIRENPEQLLEVFRDILVIDVKIESDFMTSSYIFRYRGMSKHFDVIKEGAEIPIYDVIINKDNGRIKCSFKRVDYDCLT